MNKKNVLFVVNEPAEFDEIFRTTPFFQSQKYKITFLFRDDKSPQFARIEELCVKNNIEILIFPEKYKKQTRLKYKIDPTGNVPFSYLNKVRSKAGLLPIALMLYFLFSPFISLGMFLVRKIVNLMYKIRLFKGFSSLKYAYTDNYAKTLISTIKPSVVIFAQDFVGSLNSFIAKYCKRQGIKSIIIPFAISRGGELCETLRYMPMHEVKYSALNRLAGFFFPKWKAFYKKRWLLRLPGEDIFALELLRCSMPHPWLPNNNNSIFFSPNISAYNYYCNSGFNKKNILITGSYKDDIIYKIKKENSINLKSLVESCSNYHALKMTDKLDIAGLAYKKIMLVAWPTNQFSQRQMHCQFSNYRQFNMYLCKVLKAAAQKYGWLVMVSPHPTFDLSGLDMFTNRGFLIKQGGALEAIPFCDLFIASVSSTISQAIQCGKPVINYDLYKYKYTDFQEAKGVIPAYLTHEFETILSRLLSDDCERKKLAQENENIKEEWGFLDGKSQERIEDNIMKIIDPSKFSGLILPLIKKARSISKSM